MLYEPYISQKNLLCPPLSVIPFDLVHSEVWGLAPNPIIGTAKFYFIFHLDLFTSFSIGFFSKFTLNSPLLLKYISQKHIVFLF